MIRRVIFIRHGETTGDVEGRFGGTYDDALSVTGERQVAALVEELAGAGIGRVVRCGGRGRRRRLWRSRLVALWRCAKTCVSATNMGR